LPSIGSAPKPEFDFLSFEEAHRLVAAADDEWKCMIVVALRTGLRLGELLALRREDRDLVAGVLHVRQSVTRGIITEPKSGKGRDVPLSNDALAALKEQQHLRGPLVFCADDGRMFKKNETKWPLWRACKKGRGGAVPARRPPSLHGLGREAVPNSWA